MNKIAVTRHALSVAGLDAAPAGTDYAAGLDAAHRAGCYPVIVAYEETRRDSRWKFSENKRPFIVYAGIHRRASASLDGALTIARHEAAAANPTTKD